MSGFVSFVLLSLTFLSSCGVSGHQPTYIISDKVEEEQIETFKTVEEAR